MDPWVLILYFGLKSSVTLFFVTQIAPSLVMEVFFSCLLCSLMFSVIVDLFVCLHCFLRPSLLSETAKRLHAHLGLIIQGDLVPFIGK